MLRSLTDVAIAFVELLEVEVRQLGRGARQVGLNLALMLVAALLAGGLLVAATGFLIWSLYLTFAGYFRPAPAALLTGVVLWIVIGVSGWIAMRQMKRRNSN